MFNTAVQEPGKTIDDWLCHACPTSKVLCKSSTTAECLSYEVSM